MAQEGYWLAPEVRETMGAEVELIGSPVLRQVAPPIEDMDEARKIADKLIEVLNNLDGAGLAAPQIGVSAPIFVTQIKRTKKFPDREEFPLEVFINPRILEYSEDKNYDRESCFSVADHIGLVPRSNRIVIEYTNYNGEKKHVEMTNPVQSRCTAHEYDHLQGMLYIDRLESKNHFSSWKSQVKYADYYKQLKDRMNASVGAK